MDNNKIKNENNVGKWNNWYTGLSTTPSSFVYGDTITYEKASNFLSDCKEVEDWGCGAGGFIRFRPDAIGVDGSDTPFATKKFINLNEYTCTCESIHMRHVLEHNYSWANILKNVLKSAQKKVVITLFIPLNDDVTKEIAYNDIHGVDVPDISISKTDFFNIIEKYNPKSIENEKFETNTGYRMEEIFYITLNE